MIFFTCNNVSKKTKLRFKSKKYYITTYNNNNISVFSYVMRTFQLQWDMCDAVEQTVIVQSVDGAMFALCSVFIYGGT